MTLAGFCSMAAPVPCVPMLLILDWLMLGREGGASTGGEVRFRKNGHWTYV